MSIFIDREKELRLLEDRYKRRKPEFLIIYGRRRVGKTELIKQFYKNKPHIYYLCSKESDKIQIEKIARRVADYHKERPPVIDTWEDLFSYISEKLTAQLILVIDEFPYLVEKNKAIPSLFQIAWDEYFKKKKLFLILCGSSVSMMERLLGYKSPLYGRRTGQIELRPLALWDVFKFFPNYSVKQKIEAYAVLGDMPMYLLEFDDNKDIFTNIKEKILKMDAILYKEPLFLLREELRDPGTYLTILENTVKPIRMNELSTKTKIEIHKLPKYLGILQDLRYLKKITKVTERKAKTKNTLYEIDDNFFRFWFRFVYPNLSDIEGGDEDKVLRLIKSEFNSFIGLIFEDVGREVLIQLSKKGYLPMYFERIGKWWGYYREGGERKSAEIDIVALNEKTREILFAECKWRDNINPERVLRELKEKSKLVKWNDKKREEFYCIFAKSFKKKLKTENVLLFELEDLEKITSQSLNLFGRY
jgi:hypothetical protein